MENSSAPAFPDQEPGFVNELRQPEILQIRNLNRSPDPDELDLRKAVYFKADFPDPENLLDTATSELLERFTKAEIPCTENGVEIRLQQTKSLAGESFSMAVTGAGIVLQAGSLEGARRAIYHLENALLACGPILKFGTVTRKCFIKNRISRCFFGPIKRPPHNIDELLNDIDYYPAGFLARLAREGVNGLWITAVFREICRTTFFREDPNADIRREKLRKSVEKCRRYGIKIWIFCIEPYHWNPAHPCPAAAAEMKGPDLLGSDGTCQYFCPDSEAAQKYLYECGNSLFSLVPHLGGLITISHGERQTSCLSDMNATADSRRNPCQGKCSHDVAEILNRILTPLAQGIEDATPDAELISWLYMPQQWQLDEWIYQLPGKLKQNITLAFNFESGILKEQLGVIRCGGDYWLSAVGPSDRFGRIAEVCRGRCQLAAKIQVCCSHELATIPYIPVPELLYRKYKNMHMLDVSSVIQCWYFGNFPGLMNRAAGHLAFTDFQEDSEETFLLSLARTTWPEYPERIVSVWHLFAEAYSEYPLDNKFQYYGPIQDGPVWPLHLKQCMRSLPRTWQPDALPAGDVIAECLHNHTIEEAVSLTRTASAKAQQAMEIMRESIRNEKLNPSQKQELSLCEAFTILLASAANILEFYQCRVRLFGSPENPSAMIDKLETIVRLEILHSFRLAGLCQEDSRLGYHSEAEVYKFYPEKLRWRVMELEKLLQSEFAEVRCGLAAGHASGHLIACRVDREYHTGVSYTSGSMTWSLHPDDSDLILNIDCAGSPREMNEMLGVQFCDHTGTRRPGWFQLDRWLANDSKPHFFDCGNATGFSLEDHPNGYRAIFKIPRLNFSSPFWFSIRRERLSKEKHLLECCPESGVGQPDSRLAQLHFHPEHMILVRIKE